jgi:hypothetical protein
METIKQFAALISSDYLPKSTGADIKDGINIVFIIFGAIAVIVVVYSGIQMIISQGNSEKVAQARRSIIYASAGLVIILLAQVIVYFIYGRL